MAGYRVMGTDGREYGPVNAELLRHWIGEGRVTAATLVCLEGSADWRALGARPEFRPFMTAGMQPMTGRAAAYSGYRQTNGWAIAGLICGLLSIVMGVCCCCCLPFNLFGILFSVIALVQISNNPQTQTGMSLAVLGLVLSLMSFVLGFVLSGLCISTGAAEEFMRELEREMAWGAGWFRGW